MQKLPQGANIKSGSCFRDINGVSARNLRYELLKKGAPDKTCPEEMCEQKLIHNLKASAEELAEALNGMVTSGKKCF